MVGTARLSSVSSQDSGFTSQDTLFMKPTRGTTKTKTADQVITVKPSMVLSQNNGFISQKSSFISLCRLTRNWQSKSQLYHRMIVLSYFNFYFYVHVATVCAFSFFKIIFIGYIMTKTCQPFSTRHKSLTQKQMAITTYANLYSSLLHTI